MDLQWHVPWVSARLVLQDFAVNLSKSRLKLVCKVAVHSFSHREGMSLSTILEKISLKCAGVLKHAVRALNQMIASASQDNESNCRFITHV